MIYLAGISISFFLSLLLLGKKNKTFADKILAAWLILIGIHLFFYYSYISRIIFDLPWLLGIHLPIPLMHGPILYLYAVALTSNPGISKKALVHFIPPALAYAYLIPFFLLPSAQKIQIYRSNGEAYHVFLLINIAAIIASGILYIIMTSVMLRRHRRNILDQFSSTEKINLDWIQYLIYGIALIWGFVIYGNDNFIFTASVLFVIFIGYFGIRQIGIFTYSPVKLSVDRVEFPIKILDEPVPGTQQVAQELADPAAAQDIETTLPEEDLNTDPGIDKKKYSRSGLSEESAIQLHERLIKLMDSEKIYCDPELTLTELAKRLNTHPNYLSQVINDLEAKNFYDYINSLRVDEFKRQVSDQANQKFTLISLAYDSGFNSKSTFNKYFRKINGLSPTDYIKGLKDSNI